MLKFKIATAVVVGAISGLYGWYLFASAINQHADQAATVIIQDTLITNAAFYIKELAIIKENILAGNDQEALQSVEHLNNVNFSFLESCVTDQCLEIRNEFRN